MKSTNDPKLTSEEINFFSHHAKETLDLQRGRATTWIYENGISVFDLLPMQFVFGKTFDVCNLICGEAPEEFHLTWKNREELIDRLKAF